MNKKNSVPAFAYLRVSSQGQVSGHGFDRQADTIAAWAGANGYVVQQTFRDAHTGTEADRPEFNRMLAEILSNGVRTILIESLDRLARDVMIQLLLLSKLAEHNIALISCVTGEDAVGIMSEDPMRKAMIQIQGVFSELEKSRLVGKLRHARQAKREKTGRCEGRKPYGDLKRPGEGDTIKLMRFLRRKRAGKRMSFAKIAAELNQRKIPTRTGALWYQRTVQNIIERPAPV